MQTGLHFFDMPIKGLESMQTQKIAIKMSGNNTAKSPLDDGFMAIMDTLMALSPEQLQTSLKQLEWVRVEEGNEVFAPLIDLSQLQGGMEKGSEHFLELLVNPDEKNGWPLAGRPGAVATGTHPDAFAERPDGKKNGWQLSNRPGVMHAGTQRAAITEGPARTEKGMVPLGTEYEVSFERPKINKLANEATTQLPSEKASGLQAGVKLSAVSETLKDLNSANKEINNLVSAKDPATTPPKASPETPTLDDGSKQMAGLKSEQKMAQIKTDRHLLRTDYKNVPAGKDDRTPGDIHQDHANIKAKQGASLKTEQFKMVSDALSTGSDKGLNGVNQMNEPALKETVRQNLQSSAHKTDMENIDNKYNKVQANSSVKDAALSFSSRWGAMAEKTTEMVTDAKSTDSAPDRTEQNDVIRQIVQRMTLKNRSIQSSQMNIKLKPEFLGNIRMQITSDNQQVAVRMVADSSVVKEIIEQNIHYLKAELQQHGLEINKFDVFVGDDSDELRHEQQAQLRERSRQKGQAMRQNRDDMKEAEDPKETDQENAKRSTVHDSEIDYFA